MAITEESRFQLHQRLTDVLGEDHATTLMEHLPPIGWADVATKRDLDHLSVLMKKDLDAFRLEMRSEMAVMATDLRSEMAVMATDLRSEMGLLATDLRSEMAVMAKDVESLRSNMDTRFDSMRHELGELVHKETKSLQRFMLAVAGATVTVVSVLPTVFQ